MLVSTSLIVDLNVVIKTRPRLNDSVEIQHAEFTAQPHDINRFSIDGQVDTEPLSLTLGQQRGEHIAEVVTSDVLNMVSHTVFVDDGTLGKFGFDDNAPSAIKLDVPVQERQSAPADRPEANDDYGAGNRCQG